MKCSICSTWFKGKSLQEVIDIVSSYDVDGIELWPQHVRMYIDQGNTLSSLSLRLEASGLEVPALAPYLDLMGDSLTTALSLEDINLSVAYAKQLGTKIIRIFVGRMPSEEVTELQWEQCIQLLRMQCRAYPEMIFALETHYNQPTDSVEAILDLIDKVACPNLKVLFDGFNFQVDGIDQMEALERLYEHVVHIHMKNYIWSDRTPKSIEFGDADNRALLERLSGLNYEGYISLEYFVEDYDTIIKSSIEYLKGVVSVD